MQRPGNRPLTESIPTQCTINITEFLERAKHYEHHIKQDGFLVEPHKLHGFTKELCLSFWLTSVRSKLVTQLKTP